MRRIRKTYKRPKKAYDLSRIKDERKVLSEYGLRRKKELWRSEEILRGFRRRARDAIGTENEEEKKVLLEKLSKLGLLAKGADLDDVLALNVNNVLERRLQTIIFKKGHAKSIKQARQMIVHGHINIDERRIKFPSYLASVGDEKKIIITKEIKGDK